MFGQYIQQNVTELYAKVHPGHVPRLTLSRKLWWKWRLSWYTPRHTKTFLVNHVPLLLSPLGLGQLFVPIYTWCNKSGRYLDQEDTRLPLKQPHNLDGDEGYKQSAWCSTVCAQGQAVLPAGEHAQAEPQAQRQQNESHNPDGITACAPEAAPIICVLGQNGGWKRPCRRIWQWEHTHHHEFIIHSLPLDGGWLPIPFLHLHEGASV